MKLRTAMLLAVAALVLGCSSDGGGETGTPSSSPCRADLPGPALAAIPSPAGGTTCIDETEVTIDQYAAFLAEVDASDSAQPDFCAWNDSFVPSCVGGDAEDCGAADCGPFPRTCVDWCDAFAYCAWAGKHLCGRVGGGGNTGPDAALEISSHDNEWMNACVAGRALGDQDTCFPYGESYVSEACNTGDEGPVAVLPVKSMPSCQPQGAYAGVYDLSGNVAEWVDACEASESSQDHCRVLGGDYVGNGDVSFLSPGESVSCQVMSTASRSLTASSIGFRCCG